MGLKTYMTRIPCNVSTGIKEYLLLVCPFVSKWWVIFFGNDSMINVIQEQAIKNIVK